jgi:hypothetical protein
MVPNTSPIPEYLMFWVMHIVKKNEITYVDFLTNSTMLLTFPNGLFVSGQQIIVYLDSNPLTIFKFIDDLVKLFGKIQIILQKISITRENNC